MFQEFFFSTKVKKIAAFFFVEKGPVADATDAPQP
jgi:hypothetical protein